MSLASVKMVVLAATSAGEPVFVKQEVPKSVMPVDGRYYHEKAVQQALADGYRAPAWAFGAQDSAGRHLRVLAESCCDDVNAVSVLATSPDGEVHFLIFEEAQRVDRVFDFAEMKKWALANVKANGYLGPMLAVDNTQLCRADIVDLHTWLMPPARKVHYGVSLTVNVPEFFADEQFVNWLNSASAMFAWHEPGTPVSSVSEVVVLVDPSLSGEGSDSDMPEHIWSEIIGICKKHVLRNQTSGHITVRLTNLED